MKGLKDIDELISGLDKLEDKNDCDILNDSEIISEKLNNEKKCDFFDYILDEKIIENDSRINDVKNIDEVLNDEDIKKKIVIIFQ